MVWRLGRSIKRPEMPESHISSLGTHLLRWLDICALMRRSYYIRNAQDWAAGARPSVCCVAKRTCAVKRSLLSYLARGQVEFMQLRDTVGSKVASGASRPPGPSGGAVPRQEGSSCILCRCTTVSPHPRNCMNLGVSSKTSPCQG